MLNRFEFFAEAHDWLSLLYHPVTKAKSAIFDDIVSGTSGDAIRTGESWLDKTFDPIAIASRRPGVWLRYTILAMVRNLIDWADDDFARGLPDTFQRAEERYELAQKLLGADDLKNECETIILDIRKLIENSLGVKKSQTPAYVKPLLEVQSIAALKQVAKDVSKAVHGKGTAKQKQATVRRAIATAADLDRKEHPPQSLAAEWTSKRKKGQGFENTVFFQPDPDPNGPIPPPEPGLGPPPSRPFDPFLPDNPGKPDKPFAPLDPPEPPPSPIVSLEFCIPLNPVLRQLMQQIDVQLIKLNRCLDFVGEPQVPRVYDCDTYDAATGTINRPIATIDQFTYSTDQPRYRYSFLVDKARQYVDVAERIGALLLQALQNSDNEAFQRLKAEHAVELAGATVELRRLGQVEANDGVEIASLQSERADSQVEYWNGRGGPDVDFGL